MATAAVTYTFANGTNADGTQVNANFTSVVNFLNTETVQRDASIAFTSIPGLPATDPTTDNQAVRKAYVDNFLPAGVITQYGAASAPTGWLLCQGQAISRSNALYTRLFAAISTTYGVGDGTTTFNIPNLQGRIPVGRDSTQTEFDVLAEVGGSKTHTLTQTEMPSHTHVQDSHNHTQNSHNHTQQTHNHNQDSHNHAQNAHGHTQDAHAHSTPNHNHILYGATTDSDGSHYHSFSDGAGGSTVARATGSSSTGAPSEVSDTTSSAGSHTHTITATVSDTAPTTNNNTATNQSTTATNNAVTATNQSNTAVNDPQTATNNAVTATNQNAGGGAAHNNLQPYIVVNYIIKL